TSCSCSPASWPARAATARCCGSTNGARGRARPRLERKSRGAGCHGPACVATFRAGRSPMSIAICTHAACLAHDPGPGHPEGPDRLAAVLAALAAPRFDACARIEAPRATREQLLRVHAGTLVSAILDAQPPAGLR